MNQTNEPLRPEGRSLLIIVVAFLFAIIGLASFAGGVRLITLGGSWAYALIGAATFVTGVLVWRRSYSALNLFALTVFGTLCWALWEVGFDWWPLVPRGDVVFLLGILLAMPFVTRRLIPGTGRSDGSVMPLVGALLLAGIAGVIALTRDNHTIDGALPDQRVAFTETPGPSGDDWTAYAGTWSGLKYSPLTDINTKNVGKLELAWHFRTGDMGRPGDPGELTYQITPIKIADTLYLCTPHNIAMALDPDTGKERWRFDAKIKRLTGLEHMTCRGVSYLDTTGGAVATADAAGAAAPATCAQSIFMGTNDGRLIALDAKTGSLCPAFGKGGEVNLLEGQPHYNDGWYQVTSAPLVVNNLVVVGGAVHDNMALAEPSGVIRAFDARTGALVWNFDPGRPDDTTPLKPGEMYTSHSPNMWSTPSVDTKLGLIYFPMGMGPVDQWGGKRPATTEKFATSVLALEAATGKLRWVYQTVHHDLWDMDVPAQPALVDLDLPGKGRVPAVIQTTKSGNIFVLDRRTGVPLFPTPEKPVPGDAAPGDFTSPTQPFSSVTMIGDHINESDMWGTTMFDQLWCRVQYKSLRYDGPYTPPSLKGSLVFPGNYGVMDWGGMAFDPYRQIAFAHPNYVAFVHHLIPRGKGKDLPGYHDNDGAPFGVTLNSFLSPLGIPCQQPPWGYIAGMDLKTGKIIYKRKNGNTRTEAPFGLAFDMGVPSLGGPIMTAGGVSFMSSAIDQMIRGYDVTTGKVLWKADLPAGGQATPMTYRSSKTGRQYVVVAAGGDGSLGNKLGDHIVAFALPAK